MSIKTLKTPDKIFVSGDIDWPSAAFLTLGNQPGDTEYIRKDALLEWAKEHKRVIETRGDERDAYSRGEYSVLSSLIDKLDSM